MHDGAVGYGRLRPEEVAALGALQTAGSGVVMRSGRVLLGGAPGEAAAVVSATPLRVWLGLVAQGHVYGTLGRLYIADDGKRALAALVQAGDKARAVA